MEPRIRFCPTPANGRVAYLQVGEGPPIIIPAWWYSHLEVIWESSRLRTFFEGLAQHFTVVYYDKPGCGLSDRDRPSLTLNSQVDVLEALVDHLGFQRIALFSFSQGGPAAITYAARHPERVAHLTLFSTGAFTPPPADPVQGAAVWDATRALVRAHWGLGSSVLIDVSCPGADAVQREWLARHMRESVDADTAITMAEHFWAFDVRSLLPAVRVPALVLQRRDDRVFPFDRGRELAAGLPDARFVPLDGAWHSLYEGENQDVLRLTTAYLDEPSTVVPDTGRAGRHPDRLSAREVQVLRLIAAGKSNREIAEWLVVSPNTVARHITHIFEKTDVSNRTEAAAYAHRHGLTE